MQTAMAAVVGGGRVGYGLKAAIACFTYGQMVV